MPAEAEAYPEGEEGQDLYPKDPEEHQKLLSQVTDWFAAAENHRKPLEKRWQGYYKDYRSFKEPRPKGDWRSRLYLPLVFYTVETILPKLIAQPPQFLLEPVGPEDEESAGLLEDHMKWATRVARLYPQLVYAYKSALKYGTGVLKVYADRKTTTRTRSEPRMRPVNQTVEVPVVDPDTGGPLLDPDRNPVVEVEEEPVLDPMTGEPLTEPVTNGSGQPIMDTVEEEILLYQGPVAECVDIRNLYLAPDATSFDKVRHVIQRIVMGKEDFEKKVEEGMYRLPEDKPMSSLWSHSEDEPHLQALAEIDRGLASDPTQDKVEILECWTRDGRLIAVANRRAVVRAQKNPYRHGEHPYCAIYDYAQEHEPWGVGEIEALQDLQSGINSLWNLRIDNVKLAINRIFGVNIDKLYDQSDLELRPGRAIRLTGELLPSEVLQPIDIPDVTGSSYTEVAELERLAEKVTAVSAYQTGTDSPELNDTATGVALISEQGNARFGMKGTMAEMDGLEKLGRHFGILLQQFVPDEQAIRRYDQAEDQQKWMTVRNSDLQGAFDYNVEAQSMTITESIRREQALALYREFAGRVDPLTGMPLANEQALFEDVLQSFNKKNLDRLKGPQAPPPPPPGMIPEEGMVPGIGPEPVPGEVPVPEGAMT